MRIFALLLTLLCSSLYAQPGSTLIIEDSGYFLLRTVDGAPKLEPLNIVHVLDRRTGDNPTTPVPPAPPTTPDLELSKKALGWAKEVNDPVGAQALILVYHTLAEENLPVETGIIALREASNAALFSLGVQNKWESFRDKTSIELTNRRQQGLITTPKHLSDFMTAVAIGIENAIDGAEALDFTIQLSVAQTITAEIDKAKK